MIDYGPYRLASPPRTATTWFERASFLAGFERGVNQHSHVHELPEDDDGLSVTLVRHPYEWLDSYYHELKGGFCGVAEVDDLVPLVRSSIRFEQFVNLYVKQRAGFLFDLIKKYRPTTVLRVEDLPWAAVEFFGAFGASAKQLQEIIILAPRNARLNRYNGNGVDDRQKKTVCEAETEYCEAFDYIPWKMR